MNKCKKVAVIGGDKRLSYAAELLADKGYEVTRFGGLSDEEFIHVRVGTSLEETLKNACLVIGPIPFSRDGEFLFTEKEGLISLKELVSSLRDGQILFGGNIGINVKCELVKKSIRVHDFMESDSVALKNAVATAEGGMAEAIKLSERNLYRSHCLVLGYGRCAKALAFRLKGFGSFVTVAARSQEQRLQAALQGHDMLSMDSLSRELGKFDFVFNTIPSLILTKERILLLKKDCIVIDIASKPGGTDFRACEECGILAELALGLPGRYAPKTSAEILVEEICSMLEHSVGYNAVFAAECEGL